MSPAVAMNAGGDFVVTWSSWTDDGSGSGIYARRFGPGGQPRGSEVLAQSGWGNVSSVAMDAGGGFLVAWSQQQDVEPYRNMIYVRRFDRFDVPSQPVAAVEADYVEHPTVAVNATGDFLVAWASWDWETDGGADVFARRFDRNDVPQHEPFRVNSFVPEDQQLPSAAMDADGNAVVVWTSWNQDGSESGVYGQTYDAWTHTSAPLIAGVHEPDGRQILEGTTVTRRPEPLVVSFSEDLATSGAGSVLNPANWSLTVPGPGGLALSHPVTSVSFGHNAAANRYEALLNLGGRLPDGSYTLTAKGTIQDRAGILLDGDGDGIPGGDFVLDFDVLAAAPQPAGGEIRVPSMTEGYQESGWQTTRSTGMDAEGNFVVVWTTYGASWSDADVRGRLYDAAGVPLGDEFPVNPAWSGYDHSPSVAMAPDGDFAVVWQAWPSDVSFPGGIYLGLFDATGARRLDPILVTQSGQDPDVAIDADGDVMIVWTEYGSTGNRADVSGRRYDPQGVPQGPSFRVNTYRPGSQDSPAVAMDAAGNGVVVWTSDIQDGNGGVYAQRFDAAGQPVGAEFRVGTSNEPWLRHSEAPTVAMEDDGSFVVAWSDLRPDTWNREIYVRRYDAQGRDRGPEFRVNTWTPGDQNGPSVAMDADGGFVVTWSGCWEVDGGAQEIFARRYDGQGRPESVEFRVNAYTHGRQRSGAVAMAATGEFVVAWTSDQQDPDGSSGIYAQRFGTALNHAPLAHAGGPYYVYEDTPLTLDASRTLDQDQPNTELEYQWDLDYDGTWFQVEAVGMRPVVSFADPFAARQIAVRVTDASGLTDIAVTTLEVFSMPRAVTGQKWNDLDGDGLQDAGEPGMNGWTIFLYDAQSRFLTSQVTHDWDLNGDGSIDPATETGWYSFENLPFGDYQVQEIPQPGWERTFPTGFHTATVAPPQEFRFTNDADFDQGILLQLNHDDPQHNQLQLDDPIVVSFPFINVAASGRGTVVRINTETGEIVGEYRTAPEGRGLDPSRTTVDLYGNVWVGNRGEEGLIGPVRYGSATKIGVVIGGTRGDKNPDGSFTPNGDGEYLRGPFAYSTCGDRDGDGLLRTSGGLGQILDWPDITDGVGGADSSQNDARVQDAYDECILVYQRLPDADKTRHISVDQENNVWVAGFDPTGGGGPTTYRSFHKLDGDTGAILSSFDARTIGSGAGGYGGLVDGNGVLWSSAPLLRYDPATGSGVAIPFNSSYGLEIDSYGLGIDSHGFIWNSLSFPGAIVKVDPAGNIVSGFPKPVLPTNSEGAIPRGVAVTPNDDVWVANSERDCVSRLDNDGNIKAVIPVGDVPTGVAVDSHGKVWVTNLSSNNAMRIDPATNTVDLTVDLGPNAGPYNYSDMTGQVAVSKTMPQGMWSVVQDAGGPFLWTQTTWNQELQSSEPLGSNITVEVRAADDPAALGGLLFVTVANGASFSMPGRYLEVRATLRPAVVDGSNISPVLSDLMVSGRPLYDFGNTHLAEISGTKWNDVNANGVRDPEEPGLEGWTIFLDTDQDGQYDPPLPGGWSMEIDAHATLPPGPIVDPQGFATLSESVHGGSVYNVLGPWDPHPISERIFGWHDGISMRNTWSEGVAVLRVDFQNPVSSVALNFAPLFETIGILRAYDAAGVLLDIQSVTLSTGRIVSIVRPGNEIARIEATGQGPVLLDRLQVTVSAGPGEPVTTTAADGSYAFQGLEPGTYWVREVLQDGWQQTFPGFVAQVGAGQHVVELASGQLLEGIDFGNLAVGEIRGQKFEDLDGDGVRDAGEPGLNGWRVELYDAGDNLLASDTTHDWDLNGDGQIDPLSERGWYAFVGLEPGTYTVRELPQPGWYQTAPDGSHTVTVGANPVFNFTQDADFDRGMLLQLNHDPPNSDQLQVNEPVVVSFPFINVAASMRGTVVRINTETGDIVGEYRTAPQGRGLDPSRTTVDLHGNVWVSNRAENGFIGPVRHGSATKIGVVIGGTRGDKNQDGSLVPNPNGKYLQGPFAYSTCGDRDGDGLLHTSGGLGQIFDWPDITDGAGGADHPQANGKPGDARVGDAADECILVYQRLPDADKTRHVSVDRDNNVWVAGYDPAGGGSPTTFRSFHKLDGDTGAVLSSFDTRTFGAGGYGGLIDGNGVVWSAAPLLRYDPATGEGKGILFGGSYGLGVDSRGFIWNAISVDGAIMKIDSDGNIVPGFPKSVLPSGSAGAISRGVAVTPDDDVWVANTERDNVSRLDNDGNIKAIISVGDLPTGVAVDSQGKVWVTNLGSNNAMRIDPATNAVDLTVDLGPGAAPYNYSDMTGQVAVSKTVPQGTWWVVQDAGGPFLWTTASWNTEPQGNEPPGSSITVEVCAGDNPAALGGACFVEVTNGESFSLPGRYLAVRATLRPAVVDGQNISPVLSDLSISGQPVYNFGNAVPGSIHGYKFEDRNANGVDDDMDGDGLGDEPRLGGVAIHLTGTDGKGQAVAPQTVVTDGDGQYHFEGLLPGTYTVTETPPLGWLPTTPASFTVTVASRQELVAIPGQALLPGSARLFGEPVDLSDDLVELDPATGAEINRFTPPGAPVGASNGLAYDGTRLWFVKGFPFEPQTLYELDPDDGSLITSYQISAGSKNYEGLAALGGKIYVLDGLDADLHVFDPAVGAVTQTLNITLGGQGASGYFSGLAAIRHPDALIAVDINTGTVHEIDPATGEITHSFATSISYAMGVGVVGGEIYISGGLGDGSPAEVAVYDRQGTLQRTLIAPYKLTALGADDQASDLREEVVVGPALAFGNVFTGTILGNKFEDWDADGVRDDGEPGLAGWTIYLDLDRDGQFDPPQGNEIPGEPSVTTDRSGDYVFAGLLPGVYQVAEVLQPGWQATFPGPGALLTDAVSRQLGNGGAYDLHLEHATARIGTGGELVADIALSVGWSSISSGLIPEATEYEVLDGTIFIDLFGTGPEISLPVVGDEWTTVAVPLPSPGTYGLVVTLHWPARPMLPAFVAHWEATGTLHASPPGTHLVQVTAGGTVADIDFGNLNRSPSVAISEAHGQYDHTCRLPIKFTVVFSEPVTGFAADDVTVVWADAGTPVITVTGSGATYDVEISGLSATGTVTVGIATGAAYDDTGRPSLPPLVLDNRVTYRPWTNERRPADLEGEGDLSPYVSLDDEDVTALDVLLIINYINAHLGDTSLHDPSEVSQRGYVDADADGQITAADVLFVINYINSHLSGVGEAEGLETDQGERASPDANPARIGVFQRELLPLDVSCIARERPQDSKAGIISTTADTDAAFASWGNTARIETPKWLQPLPRSTLRKPAARGLADPTVLLQEWEADGDRWLSELDAVLSDRFPEINWQV
jgi:streptogramin lyase